MFCIQHLLHNPLKGLSLFGREDILQILTEQFLGRLNQQAGIGWGDLAVNPLPINGQHCILHGSEQGAQFRFRSRQRFFDLFASGDVAQHSFMVDYPALRVVCVISVVFDPYFGSVLAPHPVNIHLFLPGIQNMTAAFFRREIEFLFDIHRQHFLLAGIPEHLHHGRVDIHKPSLVRTAVDAIHHAVKQSVITFFRFTQRRLRLFAFADVVDDRLNINFMVQFHQVQADFGIEQGAIQPAMLPLKAGRFSIQSGLDFFQRFFL